MEFTIQDILRGGEILQEHAITAANRIDLLEKALRRIEAYAEGWQGELPDNILNVAQEALNKK